MMEENKILRDMIWHCAINMIEKPNDMDISFSGRKKITLIR